MNITKKIEVKIFILTVIIFLLGTVKTFSSYSTIQSGDWSVSGTWASGSIAPLSGNNNIIYISSGNVVVLNNNISFDNGCELHVSGDLTINGSLTAWNNLFIEVSGTLIVNGNLESKNGAALIISGSATISGDAISENNGSIDLQNGTLNIGGDLIGGSNCEIIGTGTINIFGVNAFDSTPEEGVTINDFLPVELLSFNAEVINNTVKFQWKTASELNNDYFTIERSANAQDWEVIGKVNGSGTVNTVTEYKFFDEDPFDGINYYRLKQTDYDGAYEELGIIAVDFLKDDDVLVISDNTGIVILLNSSDREMQADIYDLSGKLVDGCKIKAGTTSVEIKIDRKGVYFIHLTDVASVIVRKILLE